MVAVWSKPITDLIGSELYIRNSVGWQYKYYGKVKKSSNLKDSDHLGTDKRDFESIEQFGSQQGMIIS